jgi:two-component system cell cycle response regulator DivK
MLSHPSVPMMNPSDSIINAAHILVVDDHEDSREVARTVLEYAGYTVSVAGTGTEALRLAANGPDLVLLDIVLPEVDGLEVARRLRANPATSDLRIVAVTAMARSTVREIALLAGCNAFLCKPYPVRTLRTLVFEQLLLGRAQARRPSRTDVLLRKAAHREAVNWEASHRIAGPTKGQY